MFTERSRATLLQVIVQWSSMGWTTVKGMAHHTWVGMKLLATETRVASKILARLVRGKILTRREQQMLKRVASDLFRLVPFSFFFLIPFMELLLPVALKIFPKMLPSQFEDKLKVQDDLRRKFKVRLEMAKFFQECLTVKTQDGADLPDLLGKVRTGMPLSNEEILTLAKKFKDEFMLDNCPRSQLLAMCRFLNINPPCVLRTAANPARQSFHSLRLSRLESCVLSDAPRVVTRTEYSRWLNVSWKVQLERHTSPLENRTSENMISVSCIRRAGTDRTCTCGFCSETGCV